jgi:hypothetical protein
MPGFLAQGTRDGDQTRATDASEFYLVLTPGFGAPFRASDAVMGRFRHLPEETRRDLGALVAELVTESAARRPGGPITVAAAVASDAIRGEVSDQGEIVPFEIPRGG